jgi:hypothetical protein
LEQQPEFFAAQFTIGRFFSHCDLHRQGRYDGLLL